MAIEAGFLVAFFPLWPCYAGPNVPRRGLAGAPVTDWMLYDTYYTERYLGHPASEPENYLRSGLCDPDRWLTGHPDRPLLLVMAWPTTTWWWAHTLALSRVMLEAGRPHQVLPMSGVTHMTPQVKVAENLLLLQLAFLREALGLTGQGA
ncbi:MAG: hypothetical protein CM1200mP26_05450 [Acidimicrobiales bacterium]|nr:MAG: hypothetical protein CM1200mP26_05450 [Acidimicrobiales bacterium]